MKIRSGIILFIVTIATVFSFSSCAKGTYAHKHKKSNRYNAAQVSPASRKAAPVSKNYVIKNKRKSSLGLSGRFRKGKKSDLIL
jgi:hypothetical protein